MIIMSVFSTHKNLILYVLIGVSAVVVDVGLYSFFYFNLEMPAVFATTLSVATSIVCSFLLNAFVNFGKSDKLFRRFSSFASICCGGLAFSAAVIFIFVDVLGFPALLIKLLTLPFVFAIQYTLNRRFSFHDFKQEKHPDSRLPVNGRVAVIGGGFTGLTAAYRLAERGADVTIYERGDSLGGLAGGFSLSGYPLEKAYHFLYQTDEDILSLAEELGMRDGVRFYPSTVGFFYNGKVYPFGTAMDLIRFPGLSFVDRIRTGVVGLGLQLVTNWEGLQKYTAYEYLEKMCGPRVTKVIWEPLLRGKFDRYYDKVTMSWLWGRIHIRQKSRDVMGREQLGYVHGGFMQFVDRLAEAIREHGGTIRTSTNLTAVERRPDGTFTLTHQDGDEKFDAVLFTTPSHVAVHLLGEEALGEEYVNKSRSISYLDAVVMPFITKKEIGPYFWYNITDERIPFLVLLSTSALTGSAAFGGRHVYYIGAYVPREHRYMSMPPEEIRKEWLDGLKTMFPDFDPDDIENLALFKFRDAQHIVEKGFRENKILPYEMPVTGTFLSNFTQIYPDDRGTNFAVREGTVVSELVARYLMRHKKAPEHEPEPIARPGEGIAEPEVIRRAS